MKSNFSSKGFTLIELIIVIAIIAIIVSAVFVALDPVKRLAAARNSRRRTDATAIAQAAQLKLADTGILSGVAKGWRMIGTYVSGLPTCSASCGSATIRVGNTADSNPLSNLNFDGTQDFSFAFWARQDAPGKGVITNIQEAGNIGYRIALIGNYVSFIMSIGNDELDVLADAEFALLDDNYHHFVVVYGDNDPSLPPQAEDVTIYIDGIPKNPGGTNLPAELPPYNPSFYIGGRPLHTFDGLIDDIRIYDFTLTSDNVLFLYDGSMPDDPGSPFVHWTFDEVINDMVTDESSHAFVGKFSTGAISWTSDVPSQLASGNAVEFFGSTDPNCVNLIPELIDTGYLPSVPINDTQGSIIPSEEQTYYAIKREGGSVIVRSCIAESEESGGTGQAPLIEVSR